MLGFRNAPASSYRPLARSTVFHCKGLLARAGRILDFKSLSISFENLSLFNYYNILYHCFFCGKEKSGLYIGILLFLEANVLWEGKHLLFR